MSCVARKQSQKARLKIFLEIHTIPHKRSEQQLSGVMLPPYHSTCLRRTLDQRNKHCMHCYTTKGASSDSTRCFSPIISTPSLGIRCVLLLRSQRRQ